MSQQPERELGSLASPIAGLAFSSAAMSLLFDAGIHVHGLPVDHVALGIACILVAGLAFAARSQRRLSKKTVHWGSFLAIHVAGIAALVLTILTAGDVAVAPVATALLEALALAGSARVSFYWMRKLRGTASSVVAGIALAALALGEIINLVFCGNAAMGYAAVFGLSFAQFAPVQASRKRPVLSDSDPALSETYFGTNEQRFSSRGYLAAAGMGICCIAVPIGMGMAFPLASAPEPAFLPALATTLITLLVAVAGLKRAWLDPGRPLTTIAWIAMQLTCAAGCILLALGGGAQHLGISLVSVAALLLRAFVWYLSVAFLSFGERDPYFYAAIGWLAMNLLALGGEALSVACGAAEPGNAALIVALMCTFLLVTAQIVFTQLLADPVRAGLATGEAATRSSSTPQPDAAPANPPLGTRDSKTPMVSSGDAGAIAGDPRASKSVAGGTACGTPPSPGGGAETSRGGVLDAPTSPEAAVGGISVSTGTAGGDAAIEPCDSAPDAIEGARTPSSSADSGGAEPSNGNALGSSPSTHRAAPETPAPVNATGGDTTDSAASGTTPGGAHPKAPKATGRSSARRIPLMGVMGIAPEGKTPLPSVTPDVHIATSVIELGQRFGLTGREIEVLTLYALGHTQARVSEELQLSQNTVHTHIKRIYDKTNLHSRQEILDYLAEYGG